MSREKQDESTSWDSKTEVAVSADVPSKRIAFTSRHRVAKIVFHYETFIAAYQKELDWFLKIAGPIRHRDLIKAIKERIVYSNEIDIGVLAEEIRVALDMCFYRVLYPAVSEGKICLYDIQNNCYVDSYIRRMFGVRYGPMAGHGGEVYMLPSGKVFLDGLQWRA